MNHYYASRLSLLSCATVLLAACGGGGSESGNSAGNQIPSPIKEPAQPNAGPSFGDCFKLTPGVKFVKSDTYKFVIVQEQFEGQTVSGQLELRPNDTRFYAVYKTVDADYVHILGGVDYDSHGNYDGKDVYSASARLPANMTAGQTVQMSYVETTTRTTLADPVINNVTQQVTFVGFEDLKLGGRTFKNTCKITTPRTGTNDIDAVWYAPGFGAIRAESRNAQGTIVSQWELVTVVSAP